MSSLLEISFVSKRSATRSCGVSLQRAKTLVAMIAAALGKHQRKRVTISANRSRSGAQIIARTGADERARREVFLDTFPALFTNRPLDASHARPLC